MITNGKADKLKVKDLKEFVKTKKLDVNLSQNKEKIIKDIQAKLKLIS